MMKPFAPNAWSELTAIFGGTFDPPHLGHREAVEGLFRFPGFKNVRVIPAAIPPLKKPAVSSSDRIHMVEETFRNLPAVTIDFIEIEREKTGRPSFSFDTLQELKKTGLKFAFVVGADQWENLPKWHRFPEILGLCPWVVLERKPDPQSRIERGIRELSTSGILRPAGDRTYHLPGNQLLLIAPTEAREMNSTQIRREIALNGVLPPGTLHPGVESYLKDRGLYGTPTATRKIP